MERLHDQRPPTGLSRVLFRLPVLLYRAGLGALLGRRLLYLVHTGRKTGKRRDTVIEVVAEDDGSYYVCSGFGPQAAWYRNVLADPAVTVQVGRHRTRATAVPLDAEEGARTMAGYASRHPRLAMRIARMLGYAVDGSEADYRALGRAVPFVRLDPRPTA